MEEMLTGRRRSNIEPGNLYIVGSPIGNLKDITQRAIETLEQVDLVGAEDTRKTRKLLSYYKISVPVISYHDHNKEKKAPIIIEKILNGCSVALVTDAGTPNISDPGYYIVNQAKKNQITIIPIPGVSAVITALSVSGMSGGSFRFAGYLSPKKSKRDQQLRNIADDSETTIFFEAPHRFLRSIREFIPLMGDRKMCVARELTKIHESLISGTAQEITEYFEENSEQIKGEFTVVIEGISGRSSSHLNNISEDKIINLLKEALNQPNCSNKDAVEIVSAKHGIPKNKVYKISLNM